MTASIAQSTQTGSASILSIWKPATWEEYIAYRDDPIENRTRLYFYQDRLLVDDMSEGLNHAGICDLFTMLFFVWFSQTPEQVFSSFGRCLIEKAPKRAGAPDLVLYLGTDYSIWQEGEPRRVDLHCWRVPNLVGEIADTTLATDLDKKKHLYAELEIPEYWVIDVRGRRVIAFILQDGVYQESERSLALERLPISLLEQALARLSEGTNGSAAIWFSQQLANLS